MSHAERHNTIGIHGLHQHEAAHGIHRVAMLRRTRQLALLVLIALLLGAGAVIALRMARAAELKETTRESVKLYVNVVQPRALDGQAKLTLPGTLQGMAETPVYARISGYVSHWYKDIGARVRKGELLAEIATPEVEQQLAQARATRQQAQAALQLAQTSFERWQALRQRDAVTQQELDERRNALKQGEAAVAASNADVQRLEQLLSFNRIVAPFDGVVTSRNVDVGNLIDAGNGGAPKQMFALAQIDPLRLYIAVPQSYSQQVRTGQSARVSLSELPGRSFIGSVVRTAGAIDPVARTLQVEINLPNHDGRLLPGAYVEVALQVPAATQSVLTVPNNSLLFRAEGPRVAVVDAKGNVQLHKIVIARDLGQSLEIESGIEASDKVIINPSDSIADGDHVQIQQPQANPKGAS